MSQLPYVPFHVPSIGPEEIRDVVETLQSGWLTTGPRTQQFEKEFKAYTGARHALAVNSGTAALHLPLVALNVGPGDEVITTPITFCATVNTILHVGATPVLADVLENGDIDPESVASRITPQTRAIMPVHYGGIPCDMDALGALARNHGLYVIEDAAHATGTYYKGMHLGSAQADWASDAAAFSFYATKNITTGEGGMVTTNQPELDDRMRRLALHGISKDAWNRYGENGSWYYEVNEAGFKYNLSDLQSTIGIHQLRKVERLGAARAAAASLYSECLSDVDEIETPSDYKGTSWHLYVIRLRLESLSISRDEFIAELKALGIGTSVHFIPIQLHPFYQPWAHLSNQQCPRSLELYRRIVSLPLFPDITRQQIDRVVSAVKTVARQHRKARTLSMTA